MSSQGQILKFGAVVLENMPNLSDDKVQWLIENPKQLQRCLKGALSFPPHSGAVEVSDSFSVCVDYGLSLDQMIQAGHYDRIFPHVSACLLGGPPQPWGEGKGKVEKDAALFFFGFTSPPLFWDDIVAEMDRRGFAPARIEDLLAFGAGVHFQDLKRFPTVIALGSPDYYGNAPYLEKNAGDQQRTLRVGKWSGGWNSANHFLAVKIRKES